MRKAEMLACLGSSCNVSIFHMVPKISTFATYRSRALAKCVERVERVAPTPTGAAAGPGGMMEYGIPSWSFSTSESIPPAIPPAVPPHATISTSLSATEECLS
eukprot:6285130-Prymnesium_polylepis.1